MWVILHSGREEEFKKIEFDISDKGESIIRCSGGQDSMFEIYKVEEVVEIVDTTWN